MRYSAYLKKINQLLSLVSGVLLFTIAAFAVFEAIARSLFKNPTIWSTDVSTYLLLCALFLGLAYTYQERGHVAVDILRNAFVKAFGMLGFKIIMVFTYVVSMAMACVLVYGIQHMIRSAMRFHQVTNANIQIPVALLYSVMLFGTVLMGITIVCIVLDILSGGKKYVE